MNLRKLGGKLASLLVHTIGCRVCLIVADSTSLNFVGLQLGTHVSMAFALVLTLIVHILVHFGRVLEQLRCLCRLLNCK